MFKAIIFRHVSIFLLLTVCLYYPFSLAVFCPPCTNMCTHMHTVCFTSKIYIYSRFELSTCRFSCCWLLSLLSLFTSCFLSHVQTCAHTCMYACMHVCAHCAYLLMQACGGTLFMCAYVHGMERQLGAGMCVWLRGGGDTLCVFTYVQSARQLSGACLCVFVCVHVCTWGIENSYNDYYRQWVYVQCVWYSNWVI